MEIEQGMHLDLTNLEAEGAVDLDQNLLAYLSDNNQQSSLVKSGNESYDFNFDALKDEAKKYSDELQGKAESEPSLLLEDIGEIIPEEYNLVQLNPGIELEIHSGIEMNEDSNRDEEILNFSNVIIELENQISSSASLCRLCASRQQDMIHIFSLQEPYGNVTEQIEHCLPVVIRKDDELPKQACRSCLDRLQLCYEFHKTVTEAERQLLSLTKDVSYDPEIQHQVELHDQNQENFKILSDFSQHPQIENETAVENTIEDSRMLLSTEDQYAAASSIISESTASLQVEFPACYSAPNSPILQTQLQEELRSNESVSSSEINLTLVSEDNKFSNEVNNANEDYKLDREILCNTIEEDTVPRDKKRNSLIKCQICGETFKTAQKCHVHSSVHATTNYYPCGLCDKTFTNEIDCNKHSREHTSSKKVQRRGGATHVCDECGKRFATEARLEFHKVYHNSVAKPCYCEKCNKFVASESSLYQHMLTVHGQYKEHCCDICGKQFSAQTQLMAHQRKHNNERPFECDICDKRFYSNDILRRHKKLHLPDKPYQCDQCGKRFDRNNTLTKHLLKHQVDAGQSMMCHVCGNCREVFVSAETARIHLVSCSIAEESTKTEILKLDMKAMYRCEFCEKCYTEVQHMKYHREGHGKFSSYICTVCDITFATYNQATAHKVAHKKSSQPTTPTDNVAIPKYFACEHCDKQFLYFTNMNIHRRICSSIKTWTCGHCRSIFQSATELFRHKTGESQNQTWSCNLCDTKFGSECALEIHRESHSPSSQNTRNYSCLYCEKMFSQKTHLTIHLRRHTGEKPYSCDLCDKAYQVKTDRDNHRRTHTGERPFKCSICEKTFASTARLREHTRFHSGNRPYNCPVCDQSFKKANARNVHMTIHTGEKPHQCDVCGFSFRRIGDMRKHKKTQHTEKSTPQTDNNLKTDNVSSAS